MTIDRATVRALLDLMSIDGCDFYHNEPNDYGYITMTLFTGSGSAIDFMGEERMLNLAGGAVRGSGYFGINEAGVDRVMQLLEKS